MLQRLRCQVTHVRDGLAAVAAAAGAPQQRPDLVLMDCQMPVLDAARFRHILVSYNNEGLLPEDELKAMLTAKAAGGKLEFHTLPYKRFRADADGEGRQYKGDEVREFLFYVAPSSAG
jgi:CheY-like chemotaxis protein